MRTRLDHLDGIARHARNVAHAAERSGGVVEVPASGRAARLAQAFGPGVSASAAFDRDPAYRRQLGDLIAVAAEARSRTAL